MAFGLPKTSLCCAAVVSVLAVGVFLTLVDARPQKQESLRSEWEEAVDWMVPNDNTVSSDTWRAFAPGKVKSILRWWEQTMDNDLWNSELYGDVSDGEGDSSEESDDDDEEEESEESDEITSEDSSLSSSEEEEEESLEEDDDSAEDVDNKSGEEEDSVPNASTSDDNNVDDSSVSDKSSNEDSVVDSDFIPNGDLNSFVDQRPSLPSIFGSDLSKNTWNPNSEVKDDVEDSKKDDEDDEASTSDTNGVDLMGSVREGGSPDLQNQEDVSDEIRLIDEPDRIDTIAAKNDGSLDGIVDKDNSDDSSDDEDDKDGKEITGKEKSDLQSEVEVFDSRVDDDIENAITSVIEDADADESTDSDDDDDIDGDLKDSVDVLIPTKGKRADLNKGVSSLDSDSESKDVLNKEYDSIQLNTGDEQEKSKLDSSDKSLQDWNLSEIPKKEKKGDDTFEDWADWDDSVFDDYDKSDDSDRGGKKETGSADTSEQSDVKSNKDDESDEVDEDDNWLYYDDDDEDDDSDSSSDDDDEEDEDDYDDEDSDESEYEDSDESDESEDDDYDDDDDDEDDDEDDEDDDEDENFYYYDEDLNETGEPEIELKPKPSPASQSAPTPSTTSDDDNTVEHLDIDPLSIQPADSAVAVDKNHYSSGVIYDSSHPFKKTKPSVKKDLGSPTFDRTLQDDDATPSPQEGTRKSEQDNDESAAVSRTTAELNSRQGVSNEKMSTGLESLTSPNPAPTVTTWTDTSQPTMSPSPSSSYSSPWTSTEDDLMFGDQPLDTASGEDDSSEEEEGYVDSYPLEKCHMDYECRSGRTCVKGVCKCFSASFCAGHYKPVCGSDGVQYPSHCELHRTSCVIRRRIRIDRTGKCFKAQILEKEKSWLLEQERRLEKERKELEAQEHENSIHIPSDRIIEFPKNTGNDDKFSTAPIKQEEELEAEGQKEKCNWKEMSKFKEDLLMYHCNKFKEPNCRLEVKTDRQYLSMLMFSYYDRNFDFFLMADELEDKERDEHFIEEIIRNCHLKDFVKFADTNQFDGKLTVSEFTQSFEMKEQGNTAQNNKVEIVSTLASAGDGLELKCGVQASSVVWKRYGVKLEDDKKNHKLMVFDDGALFFSKLSVHHIGNYTCMDSMDEKNAQVHRLNIQTSPIVEVYPSFQTDSAGSDVELRCHAEGLPKPVISWKHNGKDVLNSKHVSVYYGYEHIVIHNAQAERDSGSYICSAHSQAGTTAKSVTVNIVSPVPYTSHNKARSQGTFLVFHDQGITAYDPLQCVARHEVKGNFGKFKFIPDAIDSPLKLCKDGRSCQWKDATKVGSDFVYVSQPDMNRVLVVEAGHFWNPLQVIDTDQSPEKLQYVPHLDQVWVLCRSQKNLASDKTIVVIRDASQLIQHRSVHTRPVGNHFDTVEDLFIAPPNDLQHEFDHGYVTHAGKSSLSKIDLEDMSYTESIDLSAYGCLPVSVAFVPLGGHVVVQCVSKADQHTLQLVMDYLTNAIVSTTSIPGRPLVSPDSRHLITVDERTGKVVVEYISTEGQMETTYEVTVSARISDVSFMHATYHLGYDLILTSADDDDLIVMNLVTGKVEKMSGSSQSESSQAWHPSLVHRKIVAGDTMSKYIMSPSKSSLAIIDFKFKRVECEFTDLTGYKVMVHISPASTNS